MKNKLILFSALLVLATTPVLATSSSLPANTKSIVITTSVSGISLGEVQAYMEGFGIKIVGMSTIEGSENVLARSDKGINYLIYVSEGIIVGWEQVDY